MTTPAARLARLEERMTAVERELGTVTQQVDHLTERVERMPFMEARLEDIGEDAATCRQNVHNLRSDLASGLLAIRNDLNAERSAREERRSRTVIALIAASATIFAAIIAGVFVLIG